MIDLSASIDLQAAMLSLHQQRSQNQFGGRCRLKSLVVVSAEHGGRCRLKLLVVVSAESKSCFGGGVGGGGDTAADCCKAKETGCSADNSNRLHVRCSCLNNACEAAAAATVTKTTELLQTSFGS